MLHGIKRSLKEIVRYGLMWTGVSFLIGGIGGGIGAGFAKAVAWATGFRLENGWTLYLMPAAGVVIVWLYHVFHEEKNRGTNGIIEAACRDGRVSPATGVLIFISTVLTHFVGGSSGREGAALQLGGAAGSLAGKWVRLDEKDRRIAVMCGMSAVFGALFGTPAAAGIFSLEVANVGSMAYTGLVPCLFSAFLGANISRLSGVAPERFTVLDIPEFTLGSAAYAVMLGVLCAAVGAAFAMLLHQAQRLYEKYIKNPYLRILAASAIFIGLTFLVRTRAYHGSSMELIENAMEGQVRYEAFILKALFTAVALGAGFKGGEIVPTLCVGATFGCTVGHLFGMSPSFSAACGMAALFAGVTNCPMSTLVIALEMFGGEAFSFFALAVAAAFTLSGYHGLYGSQKFVYSKTRMEERI